MRSLPSFLSYILALISLLLVASCLDGREEYWIHNDGSGRLEARYLLPAVAISQMGGESATRSKIEAYFAGQKNVTLSHLALTTVRGSVNLDIKVSFTKASDFVALLNGGDATTKKKEPDALDMLLGTMTAQRDGLTVSLQRDVDIRQLFPKGLFQLKAEQTRDHQLEYIIHLPVAAKQSNAHQVTDAGKTLRWSYPLAQALQEPMQLQAVATISLPLWLYAIILLVLLLLTYALWRYRRKKIAPHITPAA